MTEYSYILQTFRSSQAAQRVMMATKDALGVPEVSTDAFVEVTGMPRQQNG